MSLRFRVSLVACGFAAVIGVLFAGSSVQAQSIYAWSNSGTDWNTQANWNPATVPGSADIGQFNSASYAYQPSVGAASSVGGIWTQASARSPSAARAP